MDKDTWEDGFYSGVKFALEQINSEVRERARQIVLEKREDKNGL